MLDELSRSQHRFRLRRDAELRLVVERTLKGAGVEVDEHTRKLRDCPPSLKRLRSERITVKLCREGQRKATKAEAEVL